MIALAILIGPCLYRLSDSPTRVPPQSQYNLHSAVSTRLLPPSNHIQFEAEHSNHNQSSCLQSILVKNRLKVRSFPQSNLLTIGTIEVVEEQSSEKQRKQSDNRSNTRKYL